MSDAPVLPGERPPVFGAAFRDQLDALFRWRRDVRRFRPDPVPAAVLDVLLDQAQATPSVGLSQPWRFVTVEDPGRRAAVRANFAACNARAAAGRDGDAALYVRLKLAGLDEAPCQLAVFADPAPAQGRGLGRETMPEMAAYSAVMAVHTLWLAARAAGLGVGWVSILDPGAVAAILEVPAGWRLVAYLCLGVAAQEDAAPELERAGWEARRPAAANRVRR